MTPGTINALRHARTIESAIGGVGGLCAVDRYVRHSWQRCLSEYRLDPLQRRKPSFVDSSDLNRRRKVAGATYSAAAAELYLLSRRLQGPVGVMLTDRDGVILGYVGERTFADIAHRSGLCEGVVWSESEQGTNGMGTCLAEASPVLIHQQEHFLYQNSELTCCAVPIQDGKGKVIGALNISGLGFLSPAPTLALLELVAQNIENRAFLEDYRQDHFILRLHPRREFVSTSGEGIVAIDREGTIVAANRSALAVLDESHGTLCGQRGADALGLELVQIERMGRDPSHDPQLLPSLPFFALVQRPPERQTTRHSKINEPPLGDPLAQAERTALSQALDASSWNVSRAAAALKLSRRTLHRKMKQHGLQRTTSGR